MNSFTGNEDTDRLIFQSLSLSDARKINAPNQYIHRLINDKMKMAKKNAIDLLDQNCRVIIKSLEPTSVFLTLMDTLKILPNPFYPKSKPHPPSNTNNIHAATVIIIGVARVGSRAKTYHIDKDDYTIEYSYYNEHFIGRYQYYGNKNKTIAFLTHIYYDHLYKVIT